MSDQQRRRDGEFGVQPRAVSERGRRPVSTTQQAEPSTPPAGSAGTSSTSKNGK
ncbi:hypothetical protein [Blastococcus sp. TF02A-26]|uniref:hypothetical protein n=1 Tax=Blastococcus sp. TF02A-26 TaxID=2250577 RepID=UPI001314DF41|nr:hypothetical protein [Blastococcus sp. TF02A-26]